MSADIEAAARELVLAVYTEGCDWHGLTVQATCEPLHRQRFIERITSLVSTQVNEALERAAGVADEIQAREVRFRNDQYHHEIAWVYGDIAQRVADEIAAEIRALKEPVQK